MVNILVSVCCITFNHRNYIRRCLDSLINQNTDFDYEIIVHDDASTDGTQEIVREYAEKHPDLIIPILQKENQYSKGNGFVEAFIMPKASGKYIVECEGDDFWCDPDKLRLQVEALEAHPECAVCVHETSTADREGNPQEMHFPDIKLEQSVITTDEFMRLTLKEGHWLFHVSSYMVSRELYREYMKLMTTGFPTKFYLVGDLPLFLYFAMMGNVYFIDRVMSVYTVESGGFMSKMKDDPQFAKRVHQGYIDGLTSFDEFSGYRFHDYVEAALVERRFEVYRISRRFDKLIQDSKYRPLIRRRGAIKTVAFYLLGYIMRITGKKQERRG